MGYAAMQPWTYHVLTSGFMIYMHGGNNSNVYVCKAPTTHAAACRALQSLGDVRTSMPQLAVQRAHEPMQICTGCCNPHQASCQPQCLGARPAALLILYKLFFTELIPHPEVQLQRTSSPAISISIRICERLI